MLKKFDFKQMNLNTWRTAYQSLLGLAAFVGTVIVTTDNGEIQIQWALVGTAFATLIAYLDNVRRQAKEQRQILESKKKKSATKKVVSKATKKA